MQWWKRQCRVIQTNLQVRDACRIDPKRLAEQLFDLGADALVFNVGGIYAWYPSEVPFHHINEFLPRGRDLLMEVIDACHERGVRFIGRFDFTRAEDSTYQRRPEWFAYDSQGAPILAGATRPGAWSLLYNTCHNSEYYSNAVAMPVLTEALKRYPMDGVFFNGVYVTRCHCDVCKAIYRDWFNSELPDADSAAHPQWRSRQIEKAMGNFRAAVEAGRPGTPLILYHWPEMGDYDGTAYNPANPCAHFAEAICDESQNVLSRGADSLSDDWTPSLKMKLMRLDHSSPPYGIIHSSPGMDWRHTGMHPAEYRPWLSQVPANGGALWHSLTGIPDTITDKRLLSCVKSVNDDFALMLPAMSGSVPIEDLLLLYNRDCPPKGWLKALYERQTQFGIAYARTAHADIFKYTAVLLPERFPVDDVLAQALANYSRGGGRLLIEGDRPELNGLRGIEPTQKRGEYLVSSYLMPDVGWPELADNGLDQVRMLPFRGTVTRTRLTTARMLACLVPTFAPLDAVGAPPERASILTPHTDIPLVFENEYGLGKVVSLSFSLAHLIEKFSLGEHLLLAGSIFDRLIASRSVRVEPHYPGLIVTLFRSVGGTGAESSPEAYTIHFVNGAGKRPLYEPIPLHNIRVTVNYPGLAATVRDMQRNTSLPFVQKGRGGALSFTVERVDVWTTLMISEA